jgi:hypothetical protein
MKNEVGALLHRHRHTQSKSTTVLNVRAKTMKCSEESTGVALHDLEFG